MPVAWNTASNEAVKFEPRSRIRNVNLSNRSSRVKARLRACCTVHSPVVLRGRPGRRPPARVVLLFGQPAVPGQERRRRDGEHLGTDADVTRRARNLTVILAAGEEPALTCEERSSVMTW
jgi:hypothetical protein